MKKKNNSLTRKS